MGRTKPDEVKIMTGGNLAIMGGITLTSEGRTVKLGSNQSEPIMSAKRLENALTKLQDAQSALKLAAEELAIVDAEMIGSDAHRRLIVESSAEDPIKTADDITSHRVQSAEVADYAAEVAKLARAVKGKAEFISAALGSVYSTELLAGDREMFAQKDKQKPLFPNEAE